AAHPARLAPPGERFRRRSGLVGSPCGNFPVLRRDERAALFPLQRNALAPKVLEPAALSPGAAPRAVGLRSLKPTSALPGGGAAHRACPARPKAHPPAFGAARPPAPFSLRARSAPPRRPQAPPLALARRPQSARGPVGPARFPFRSAPSSSSLPKDR